MCGIAGRFNYDAQRAIDPDVLAAMTETIRHRGPDAAGFFRRWRDRPRTPAAQHHRSEHRRSAGRERGRPDPGRLQRRDLQLCRACAPSFWRPVIGFAPARTPKSSSTGTSNGEIAASSGSAACSRSRCGMPTSAGCFSRAIGSVSSRCTTQSCRALVWSSDRRSRRSSRIRTCRATGVPRRSTAI